MPKENTIPMQKILVVGAGPSGLIFALECARHGLIVRVIEKRSSRGEISKATGLASGALEWLKHSEILDTILAAAQPMKKFVFYDNNNLVAEVPVPEVGVLPPAYMYPQLKIEYLLEKALSNKGINVEYSTELVGVEDNNENKITVKLDSHSGKETIDYDWLIGADGAHSFVRELSGLDFIGREYLEDWSVSEASTDKWETDIQAKLYLNSQGVGLFMSNPETGVVQGILNSPGAGERLKDKLPGCEIKYERSFRVALKRVVTPRKDRIWLIGDAAHVQSPVGGQGLNLALWDGVTLAQALVSGNLGVEKTLAKRAKIVLRFTDFDYRMLSTKSSLLRGFRNTYWKIASHYPFIAKWFFHMISGKW